MQTIAILSQKGGAGKSTLAVHLAVELGAPVLDLDPQQSAARWRERRAADTPLVLPGEEIRPVAEAARQDGYPFLIIDTPAQSGIDARRSAEAADLVLIPARPSAFDLDALGDTMTAVQWLPYLRGKADVRAAIVLNAVPAPRGAAEAAETRAARTRLEAWHVAVCPVAIAERAAYRRAVAEGLTAQELSPGGRAADEIRRLAAWIREQTAGAPATATRAP